MNVLQLNNKYTLNEQLTHFKHLMHIPEINICMEGN